MREARKATAHQQRQRAQQDECAETQGQAQHRRVNPMGQPHQPRLLFLDLLGQEQAGQHGREGQRENQRAGQREDHRQRHRLEQFSFHPFQREDGQEHDQNDADAKGDGPRHFQRGAGQRFLAFLLRSAAPQLTLALAPGSAWRFPPSPPRRPRCSPKSTAPRLNKLAEMPVCSIKSPANSMESGMAAATTKPGPQIAQEREQDDDHQQRARQQVVLDGVG